MPKDLKSATIVFFGTPEFAVPSLHALIERAKVVAVVTQPDKPVGRSQELLPSPVKVEAEKHGITILQPEKLKGNDEFLKNLTDVNPDFLVVVAYGRIIPQAILDIAPAINVHPSLLPELRGPSPIQTAMLQGKTETGISIMLLDADMDHGPILAQRKIELLPDEQYPEADARIARHAADFLTESLDAYIGGLITPKEQDHTNATLCSIIKKEDGVIDWNHSAADIYNQLRALTPWPSAYTMWNGKQVKLLKVSPADYSGTPGTTKVIDGLLYVFCGSGALRIDQLQLEGKKLMDAAAFLNGNKSFGNTTLGN